MSKEKYYQLAVTGKDDTTAEICIYGDISSYAWDESDTSSHGLAAALADLPDTVRDITVRINSYGGEVAEGVAIYNALRAHQARVTTICDGFACSIASVIFMAGDNRIMSEASLLMIHNASSFASGTAARLRKAAEDLETVTELSKSIYLAATDLNEDELSSMMDNETFIPADEALAHGFATEVRELSSNEPTQSARAALVKAVMCGSTHTASVSADSVDKDYPTQDTDTPTCVQEPQENAGQGEDDTSDEPSEAIQELLTAMCGWVAEKNQGKE